jgi:integrase
MGVKVREHRGAWWLFIDWQGRRKAKRVGEGKQAKKAADLAKTQLQAKLALGDASVFAERETVPAVTFGTLADEWLEKYPAIHAVAPTTMENYRSFTIQHLVPYFGPMAVAAITADKIEDFIAAKRASGGSVRFAGKPLSDGSLRTGLLALRLILQRGVRTRLIAANPAKEVDWRGATRIAHVDPFTGAELRAILATAQRLDPSFASMLRLWSQAGMRAGEVCGLQWGDFDLERGVVLVQRTWTRNRLGPTKTRRSRLVSFVHPITEDTPEWRPGATAGALAAAEALRSSKVRGLDPERFVFGRDGQPMGSMELHRAWRRVLTAAKVRYRVPEQLRHTFASTLLSRNAPLLYVQQQGGWRSANVLLQVYARWMPQDPSAAFPGQPSATSPQPKPLAAVAGGGPGALQLSDNAEPLRVDPERGVELAAKVFQRDRRGELDDLRLVQAGSHAGEERIVHLAPGDRDGFRVGERGALGLVEEPAGRGRLHRPDLVLGYARLHPTGCVDVDSEGAAVDERHAKVDHRQQPLRQEARFVHGHAELLGRPQDARPVRHDLGDVQQRSEHVLLLGEEIRQNRIVARLVDFAHSRHVSVLL